MNDYNEFKPILAEIEEKPPNPLGRIFLWTIILFMVVVISGLCLVKVDVVVSARGKIMPSGDIKVMQPFETGVVRRIYVQEGDFVKKGDVLIEIDPSLDKADLEGKEKNLRLSTLAIDRIGSVLENKDFAPEEGKDPSEIIETQRKLYQSQKAVYVSTLKEKEKELRGTEAALKSIKEEIEKLKNLLSIVLEEEERQELLVDIGAIAEKTYREKIKEKLNLERELQAKNGQAEEYTIQTEKIREEIKVFKNSFREKLLSELSGNVQQKNTLQAEVSNLKFREEKRFITSPVNGYIYLLPVKTVGGVVTSAQPVVSIVPEKLPLIVKSFVSNKDIGFIKIGQKCVIKIDTYDFQKYGTLKGKVAIVSPSSVEDKENNIDGYPVYASMSSEELRTKDGRVYRTTTGMSVTIEINIGKRRVIELFLFPIIKYLDEGLKIR
ncbi:MAG: HlyD family type I secretion periplasmic adaptor subunit [Nitrospira bacterium HGW-Nitrospira-1]|nr:MAG: HlyD family type I secretion periplasmic adaptor subunit [Nitrospira bacterium HGW-Nitrospira-1]